MMQRKRSLSKFCLTNVRNLKVFIEVHGRDIAFAKSEQSNHFTSTGRDINQSYTPLYAYILKAINNATGTSIIVPINISFIYFVFVLTSVPNVGERFTKT